ncbi:MAG: MFS transporter [Peptococcaceae bacterium]|nr:MFS transporter [Peptococcaceae bacterium]
MSEFVFERRLDKRVIISVIATGLITFTGVCAETAMNVIFPTLMKEFGIGTSTVQWVTTINLLMLAIIIPTSSWLKKCFRTRTLFAAAIFFFTAGTLLGLWSPNFFTLILGRMLQGVGTGMALPMMSNIIIEQVPVRNTATIMGCATLTIALGPALGPAIGGAIVGIAGWRMIFAFLLPFVIISAIGGLTCIYQSSAIDKQPFDLTGFLLLAVCFVCLLVPLSNISHWGVTNPVVWILIVIALVALLLFKRHCDKRDTPLLNLMILRTPAFSLCLIALLLCQFLTLARGFMIPNAFQLVNGESAFLAGCIVLPACIIGALLSPVGGRLYDTLGPKLPITLGFLFILVDITLETVLMLHVSAYIMMAICIIYCVGQSLATGNTITFALRNLPETRTADGTAVINTMQQLFGAVGTAVASTVVSFGQATMPADLSSGTAVGVQWALYMCLALAIVMLLCALKALSIGKK